MPIERTAYLLSTNHSSDRTLFSANLLREIGFKVVLVKHIPHENSILSNRLSMQLIYDTIQRGSEEFAYVFEDDINKKERITLEEIVKYEILSDMFFYLGICENRGVSTIKDTYYSVFNHKVVSISGNVRGLHAIGLSKKGASELLRFSNHCKYIYMDMVVEEFTKKYPANIVRYDLEGDIPGHRGILFQDRKRFPSTIK